MVTILGIDPGLTKPNPVGLALVGPLHKLYDYCFYTPDQSLPWSERLPAIVQFIEDYIAAHRENIQAVAYEIPFVGPNPLVGVMLAHIGGIIQTLAWQRGLPCIMVRPAQAKIALTGHGNASKEMMIREVSRRFNILMTKDEADAVGIALAGMEALK